MRAVGRLSAIPALLLAASAVAVLYEAYRYPLRINNAATSPTYRNTPLSLQAGKYAVLALLAVALLGVAIRDRRELGRLHRTDLLLLCLGSYALLRAGLAAASTHATLPLENVLPFVCGIPFAVVGASWLRARPSRSTAFISAAAAFGGAVVVLHAAVNVVEMALWAASGRLPALGYSHNLVRFGGIWDDPNGTAVFSALVATAVLGGALRGGRRTTGIVLAATVFNLVVAWSFSGWLVFAIGVVGVGVPLLGWRKVAAGVVALGGAVAAVIALAAVIGTNIGSAANTKLSSARLRLALNHHLVHVHGIGAWLLGASASTRLEDAFGTWLATTGAIGLVLLVAWVFLALTAIATGHRLWLLVDALGLLVASLFVPFFVGFPIGFFFVLMLGMGAALQPLSYARPRPVLARAPEKT
jgi:hypothetical protein